MKIEVSENGPYVVTGSIPLADASVNKPFCNRGHASIRFTDGLME